MLDVISTQTTKQRIMDAAEDVVMNLGAAHLTFDELVKHTGLSKGGILYHFPSKKALLREMVKRMIDHFNDKRDRAGKDLPPSDMKGAQTYILASFDPSERDQLSSTTLMAAAANDPELLDAVKEHYRENFKEIRGMGDKSILAAMLFLVADGIWLLDAFNLCPLDNQERDRLKTMLLKLADDNK